MAPHVNLPLNNMAERHPGLTPALAEYLLEAARVCLDRHHSSPASFSIVDGEKETVATLQWQASDERSRVAHANEIDATESGAYACALASTELSRGLFAMGRAETLTGSDFYLAPIGTELGDLESCIRLEVSGTDKGTLAYMYACLANKQNQARAGKSNLPAVAAVVGFELKRILIRDVRIP